MAFPPEYPTLVAVTFPVVLVYVPGVDTVTLTDTAQLAPAARLPPVKLIVVALAGAENVPPQVLVAPGVEATCIPEGRGSLTATPVSVEVSLADADRLSVKVEVVFGAMFVGKNVLVIDGAAFPVTTKVALELIVLLVVVQPLPWLFEAVTAKVYVPGGVSFAVVIIKVEVEPLLEMVVGVNVGFVSFGGADCQVRLTGFEVQFTPTTPLVPATHWPETVYEAVFV